jgi:hypothetical protein
VRSGGQGVRFQNASRVWVKRKEMGTVVGRVGAQLASWLIKDKLGRYITSV